MITIIILVVFNVICYILYKIMEEKVSYSDLAKNVATFCVLAPMLSILFWVLWESRGVKNYENLQNNKVSITQDLLLTQQNNNTISAELIDRIEKHNNACEAHYELYQETKKWCLLGKGDSALDLKIEIPQNANIYAETTEVPAYQTTVIYGTEYELVPKDNIH